MGGQPLWLADVVVRKLLWLPHPRTGTTWKANKRGFGRRRHLPIMPKILHYLQHNGPAAARKVPASGQHGLSPIISVVP